MTKSSDFDEEATVVLVTTIKVFELPLLFVLAAHWDRAATILEKLLDVELPLDELQLLDEESDP